MREISRTFTVRYAGAFYDAFEQQPGEPMTTARDKAFESFKKCRKKHPHLEITIEMRTNETLLTYKP